MNRWRFKSRNVGQCSRRQFIVAVGGAAAIGLSRRSFGQVLSAPINAFEVCVDDFLYPPNDTVAAQRVGNESLRIAFERNRDNEKSHQAMQAVMAQRAQDPNVAGSISAIPTPQRMAIYSSKKWEKNAQLRVRFVQRPSLIIENRLTGFAKQWEQLCSVRLLFTQQSDAEIKIAFANKGSSSLIGTDALLTRSQPNRATMNFGWLTDTLDDARFRAVVLHEFGHALGAIHEHNHPNADVPWNTAAVFEYYRRTQGWDDATIQENVLKRYNRLQINDEDRGEYDRKSIMHYPVDPKLLTNPNDPTVQIGFNSELSDNDKAFIARVYGPPPNGPITPVTQPPLVTGTGTLSVGGPEVTGTISAPGKVDAYGLTVASGDAGFINIVSSGNTRLQLTLLDGNQVVLETSGNDNTIDYFNARIVRQLSPGPYSVRVSHRSPNGIGKSYGIRVLRRL